jgi:hypothetical protein
MTTDIFEHGGLRYSVGAWVADPHNLDVGWADHWEGDVNPNPVAFAGSPIPAERAGLDLNPVLAAAIGQMLRRVWVLPTTGDIRKLLEEHLGEGGALELGNPSPAPHVRCLGRRFCSATGAVRLPDGSRIPIHLLVDRDHDRDGIRAISDNRLKLYAVALR